MGYLGLGSAISRAWEICRCGVPGSNITLQRVMEITRDANCSDERDRVYGILSLVGERKELAIQVDYNLSTVEVFKELMLKIAIDLKNLALLTSCELNNTNSGLPSWVPNWSVARRCRELYRGKASLGSPSPARYRSNGSLIVCVCRAATITSMVDIYGYDHPVPDSDIEAQPDIKKTYLVLQRLLLAIQNDHMIDIEQQKDIICRTLGCSRFADDSEPRGSSLTDPEEISERIYEIANSTEDVSVPTLVACMYFLIGFRENAIGRAFVFTKEGPFGLAPRFSQSSDIIVVVLGCHLPLVLRPTRNQQYLIVGECYVHPIAAGDLFLGPLAEKWRRCNRFDEQAQVYIDNFFNRETGSWQPEDPRLGPLPDMWYIKDHPKRNVYNLFGNFLSEDSTPIDPRMTPEGLRARGVHLEDIELV